MKFGLRCGSYVFPEGSGNSLNPRGKPWADTLAHVRQAERDGFTSYWVMDHFYQLPVHYGQEDEPFFDAWTVLPALAAATERIRIGPMVSPVGYRNPALLARMAASLDHLSGGRLNFGFGAGGYKPEYEAYGYTFEEPGSIRLAQMREALELMIAMWTQPRATYHGEHFRIEGAVLEPKPLQKPHPPILIGGVGPKITLRVIAEFGAACNLWGPPAAFAEQRETLKRHCEDLGTDEGAIEKTSYDLAICAPTEAEVEAKIGRLLPNGREDWMSMIGTPAQLMDLVGEYEAVGADHLCLEFPGNDLESIELFAEGVIAETGDPS